MKLKEIRKNYFMCPQEKLNFILKHMSEIAKMRSKIMLNSSSVKKNQPKTTNLNTHIDYNCQKNCGNNKISQSLQTSKTLDKIPSIRKRNNNLNNNNSSEHKSIKNFRKRLKIPKFKMNNMINDGLRTFHSDKKIFMVKDIRMVMHYRKYKDLYKKNEDYDSVKKTFIDDYKKNLQALNNVLSVNDNGKEEKKDNIKYINKKTNTNTFEQKPYIFKYIKQVNNDNFHFYSTNKDNNTFFNYSKTKINNKNKLFKELYKTNSKLENEILNNSDRYRNNIKYIKRRKLVDFNCLSIGGQRKGMPKINQDCYIILDNILNCKEVKIFGVLDGHGEYGDSLTQEIRDMFEDYFSNIKNYDTISNINGINIFNYLSKNNYEKIYEIFQKIDEKIHQKYSSNNYCIKCGTTTNILILFYNKKSINKLISLNLGNTKSILINDNKQIKQLNECHTPINQNERKRIEDKGGEIRRAEWMREGPLRIWYKGKKDSGLSITRSFGDFDNEPLGVISTPDIKEYDIDEEKIKIIIIATEGLWTFLKNEKIMDIVLPYYKNKDIKGATKKLTEIAHNIWQFKNPYEICDVTIIVLFFK